MNSFSCSNVDTVAIVENGTKPDGKTVWKPIHDEALRSFALAKELLDLFLDYHHIDRQGSPK